jgi:hypothetical protein
MQLSGAGATPNFLTCSSAYELSRPQKRVDAS